MKKTLLACLLMLSMSTQAQDVYNELRQKNRAVVENPQSNDLVKKISQFKLDALNYMAIKMQEEMPDSSVQFLDRQAYAMNAFVQFYIEKLIELNKMPGTLQVQMTKLFMDASYSNPLFKDKDKEMTLSYYNRDCLTRFSLDTDWPRALAAITHAMDVSE